MNWANGSAYRGSFLNGAKHGSGEFIGRDGSVYTGEWKNNLREGNFHLLLIDDLMCIGLTILGKGN